MSMTGIFFLFRFKYQARRGVCHTIVLFIKFFIYISFLYNLHVFLIYQIFLLMIKTTYNKCNFINDKKKKKKSNCDLEFFQKA